MENSLEQLSAVWHWAKVNTNVPHDVVDQHIQNMTDIMNSGREVLPMLMFDTDRTLTRFKPAEYNVDLFEFGQAIENATQKGVWRQMVIFSTSLKMALDVSDRLDPDLRADVASKRDVHPYDEKDNGFVREMLIDDQGLDSPYVDKYASVVIPTWDKGLIAFPKPK